MQVSEFATWHFLGHTFPQLGVEQKALKSDHFLLMDRSIGQDAADKHFVRFPTALSPGKVSVYVNSDRVTSIVVMEGELEQDLEQKIERDARCARQPNGDFTCQLNGPFGTVEVATCGRFVLIYSPTLPRGRAQVSGYCRDEASREEPGSDGALLPPQESSPPDFLWPLIGLGLALMAACWLVLRSRSRRRRLPQDKANS
jgi:hypothetical protein